MEFEAVVSFWELHTEKEPGTLTSLLPLDVYSGSQVLTDPATEIQVSLKLSIRN